MAEVPRNQQGLRVILVLRSNAGGGAISAGGRDRRGGCAQPGEQSTVSTRARPMISQRPNFASPAVCIFTWAWSFRKTGCHPSGR